MTGAISTLVMQSSWGTVRVEAAHGQLLSCHLPPLKNNPAHPLHVKDHSFARLAKNDEVVLEQAAGFIRHLLAGRVSACPPLAAQPGTEFFRRIMAALQTVPCGTVVTYGSLAAQAGFPGAARAAGTACGANILPLFIPCHRVVAAGGKLGGYSSGLPWKKHLLAVESASAGVRACA